MSRRKFLEVAGATTLAAAAPEVIAVPEENKDILSLENLELTRGQCQFFMTELEKRAPYAQRVRVKLSDPEGALALLRKRNSPSFGGS